MKNAHLALKPVSVFYSETTSADNKIKSIKRAIKTHNPKGIIIYFDTNETNWTYFNCMPTNIKTVMLVRDLLPGVLPENVSVVGSRDLIFGITLVENIGDFFKKEKKIDAGIVVNKSYTGSFPLGVKTAIQMYDNKQLSLKSAIIPLDQKLSKRSSEEEISAVIKIINPDQYDILFWQDSKEAMLLFPYISPRVVLAVNGQLHSNQSAADRNGVVVNVWEDREAIGYNALKVLAAMIKDNIVRTLWIDPKVHVYSRQNG